MFSEAQEPIAPDGSVPIWQVMEKVIFTGTWNPALTNITCRVIEREWRGTYWGYRIRRVGEGGGPTTTWAVGPELKCVRHNTRGSTEHAGRKIRLYCSCGHFVRETWDD